MFKNILLMAMIELAANSSRAASIDLSKARIVVLNPRQSTSVKAASLLKDEIEKKTRISLSVVDKVPEGEEPLILIGTASDLAGQSFPSPAANPIPDKPDAYAIWVGAHG